MSDSVCDQCGKSTDKLTALNPVDPGTISAGVLQFKHVCVECLEKSKLEPGEEQTKQGSGWINWELLNSMTDDEKEQLYDDFLRTFRDPKSVDN